MTKKEMKKARKELEKIREEYLRGSYVKTDEEETSKEDKHWEELISIIASGLVVLRDINRNLLRLMDKREMDAEERRSMDDGYRGNHAR